jgi:beta-phosphoglucomutase-like phosphatase (HAD superfamily)
MIRAALFDMDGLMIDSELLQSQAYEKVIHDHGKNPILNDEGVIQTVGVREKDNWELIKKSHDLNIDTESLIISRVPPWKYP